MGLVYTRQAHGAGKENCSSRMFDLLSQGNVLVALTIPIVSGLVGWGTNVLAIKMMFHPAEYRGLGPWIAPGMAVVTGGT